MVRKLTTPSEDHITTHIMEVLKPTQEACNIAAEGQAADKEVPGKHWIAILMAQSTFEAFPLLHTLFLMETLMVVILHIRFLIEVGIDFDILPESLCSLFRSCINPNIEAHHLKGW